MIEKILTQILPTLRESLLTWEFLAAVLFILLMERLFPADRGQKMFGTSFLHDAVWVVPALLFDGIFVAAYARLIERFYHAHLDFLTVHAAERLPETAHILLGILLADFLAWFQHWLKHKVPWFWYVHEVHHSQREINLFTDFRFHFFEYLISRPIVIVPLLMLEVKIPYIVVFSVLSAWQTRFYHANIRTNLGPLRYLFVTPQSHRVHHSIEPRHYDKNFGLMLSVWDRLFGTQSETEHEYPETGLAHSDIPIEKEMSLGSMVTLPLRQLWYPFRKISRSFRK